MLCGCLLATCLGVGQCSAFFSEPWLQIGQPNKCPKNWRGRWMVVYLRLCMYTVFNHCMFDHICIDSRSVDRCQSGLPEVIFADCRRRCRHRGSSYHCDCQGGGWWVSSQKVTNIPWKCWKDNTQFFGCDSMECQYRRLKLKLDFMIYDYMYI